MHDNSYLDWNNVEHLDHRLFQYVADDWKSSYVPRSVPYREESYPDKERTKNNWPMAHDKNWRLAAPRRTPLIGIGPTRSSLVVTLKQSRRIVTTAVLAEPPNDSGTLGTTGLRVPGIYNPMEPTRMYVVP